MLATSGFCGKRVWMAAAVLLCSTRLDAQSWIKLPNGELGYITDYTTTGFFECGETYAIIGTCRQSGNSITLGNGGNFMTLVFQGISQVIVATNTHQQHYLGTVTKSFSGPGQFTFPGSRNINAPLFFFTLNMSTSLPGAGTFSWWLSYHAKSLTNITCDACAYTMYNNWFYTTPPPPGYDYSAVDWSYLQGTDMNVYPGQMVLTAGAAIVPEPSTLLLTMSGCAGLVPLLWRTRRKRVAHS